MPKQRFTLESIPEEEDEFDLLMTDVFESPNCFGYHGSLPPHTTQVTSHASVLAPQPWYGNPAENAHIAYPHHYSSLSSKYEYTPPYLQEAYSQAHSQSPSPASSASSFHTAPTTPSHSVPDDQVRLRFIARALGFPMSSTAKDLEKFLSRNLVVITCLSFNIVPNPDLIFNDDSDNSRCGLNINRPSGKQFNKALLRAIQQQEWTHPDVKEAVRLSMTDEVGALAILVKKRASHILPDVSYKMKEMVWEEPALEDLGSRKLHEMAVQQMRENRPYSLLRNVVRPEDVVL